MYRNNSIWDDLKYQYNAGGVTTRLIFINVVAFVLVFSVNTIMWLFNLDSSYISKMHSYLWLSSDFMELITKPWTFITYMFMHAGILHILMNMLFLYWFSRIFSTFLDEKKILPIYLYGGIAGGLLYLISYNLLPVFAESQGLLVGASGAVLAVVFATATLVPDYEIRMLFIGNVKIKWIAAFFLLVNIITIPNGNAGGNFAHLGGALLGYLFTVSIKAGNDWSLGFYSVWDAVLGAFSFKQRAKPKVVYKSKSPKETSRKRSETSKSNQEKTDEILDKISHSGYDSLTKEEKAFLFKISKD